MRRILPFLPAILVLAAIAVFASLLLRPERFEEDRRLVGEPFPALDLATLPGHAGFDPAEIEGAYLVNLWGSWCPPCEVEHPVLMRLREEGVPIYGIAWRDRPEAARAFLARLGNPFAGVVLDPEGRAAVALGATGAPETYVVGADGRIRARWAGALTPEVVQRLIYPALAADERP